MASRCSGGRGREIRPHRPRPPPQSRAHFQIWAPQSRSTRPHVVDARKMSPPGGDMESIAAVAERVRRYVNDAMEEVAERAHGASAETESIRASLVAINADLEAEVSSLEDALRAA